jgi:hypothetical protein
MGADVGKALQLITPRFSPQKDAANALLRRKVPSVVFIGNHGELARQAVIGDRFDVGDSNHPFEPRRIRIGCSLRFFQGIEQDAEPGKKRQNPNGAANQAGEEFHKNSPRTRRWGQTGTLMRIGRRMRHRGLLTALSLNVEKDRLGRIKAVRIRAHRIIS